MRPMVGLTLLLLGFALMTPSCAKFNLFRRGDASLKANGPPSGAPAPEIDGEDFNGKRMKLSDHKGNVAVVVFWFSRCPPCRAMIPHERELVHRHQGKPFVLFGVNCDENLDDARKMMDEQKMVWRMWKPGDGDKRISQKWGIRYFPATFVIDRDGIIRHTFTGEVGANLDDAVEKLLAEQAKNSN